MTSKPALAATSAIPAPMMPEPTIPTRFVSMINLRFARSYVDAVPNASTVMQGQKVRHRCRSFPGPDRGWSQTDLEIGELLIRCFPASEDADPCISRTLAAP